MKNRKKRLWGAVSIVILAVVILAVIRLRSTEDCNDPLVGTACELPEAGQRHQGVWVCDADGYAVCLAQPEARILESDQREERISCLEAREPYGYTGSHRVTYDLSCVNERFGTCDTGWQALLYDHMGCAVSGDPGESSVGISHSRDTPGGYIMSGLQCGSSRRSWPGPTGTPATAQCVTSFLVNGIERVQAGRVCNFTGNLLPRFPSGTDGPAIACSD